MTNNRVYKIHLSISTSGDRYNHSSSAGCRIAPSAFAISARDIDPDKILWGKGYAANSQVYFAYGTKHILDEILIEELGNEDFRVDIYLKNIGTGEYIEKFIGKWLRHDGTNSSGEKPNNFEAWREFNSYWALGKVQFIKATEEDDIDRIKELSKLATRLRKEAPICTDNDIEGVNETGLY
ncbi:MAG: hypothetical protein JKY82_03590 [Rhizobiaceae bacterium]|nr:hypothetical protein [Rhizobiaceae bacterium]